jgi:hypothetical protein
VDDLEREAQRKALGIDGEHVQHVTHRIEPVDSREPPANRNRLREFDFSGQVRLGNVEMNPGAAAIPSQPLIVATSSEAIIENHSGIFTQPLLRFLIPYIALIESKLALNPTEDVEMKQRTLAK